MKMNIIPDPPKGYTWQSLMHIALEEAQKAKICEEIPVGAVLIHKNGEILARAHNKSRMLLDPTAHAEILALRDGAQKINNFRLLDCYLIVTLEPCIMCLGAIREARINGIIFGAYDNKEGAITSFIEGTELALHNPKPWFMGGIEEEKCKEILQDFFIERR